MSRSTNQKLQESLIYLLEKAGSMEIMRLAKLLYLTDYLFAKTFGHKHGYMGDHARYDYGPVPVGFYPVYDSLIEGGLLERQVNTISLVGNASSNGLSEQELACLDKVIEEFSGQTLQSVKNAAYSTEPMKSIQAEETQLGIDKLMYEKMNFALIGVHPLFQGHDLDISFMDDPEFQKNLA